LVGDANADKDRHENIQMRMFLIDYSYVCVINYLAIKKCRLRIRHPIP
jgi:hypothetical protein